MYQYQRLYAMAYLISMLVLFTDICLANGNQQNIYEKTTAKLLSDILEDVEFAVTEHNLRIVGRLHIGQAVRQRGNENFPDYEVILYCSITFAEKMLEFEPRLINACPGRITVRENEGSYVISAPLWPLQTDNVALNEIMVNMNNTVRKIVDYAALEWIDENEK